MKPDINCLLLGPDPRLNPLLPLVMRYLDTQSSQALTCTSKTVKSATDKLAESYYFFSVLLYVNDDYVERFVEECIRPTEVRTDDELLFALIDRIGCQVKRFEDECLLESKDLAKTRSYQALDQGLKQLKPWVEARRAKLGGNNPTAQRLIADITKKIFDPLSDYSHKCPEVFAMVKDALNLSAATPLVVSQSERRSSLTACFSGCFHRVTERVFVAALHNTFD